MPKKIKYKHFVETLLQIIEDKSIKLYFPIYFYFVLILCMYCQFAGYVFSTYETKQIIDPNIRYFAHIMEYAPGTFLLYVTANDSLTFFFFVIFEIFLYGYIFYLVILTFLRLRYKFIINKFLTVFQVINYILQIFFSCFLWIFYMPFTEIHAGMAVCGENSFLTAYRGVDGCDKKPFYQILMGVMGIFLTFFTGCLLNYFYVSYEFEEKNYLKRKFSWNLMVQMLARTLLVSFYYLKIENIALVKHITSHILGLSSCLDVLMNLPFRNKTVMIFYGSATFIYEISMALFSIWNLTDFLPQYNLFYFWCIMMPLCFGLMYTYWSYFHFCLIRVNFNEMGNYYSIIEQYLEEISSLSENAESNKEAKVKLCGILKNHLNQCFEPQCIFKKNTKFEIFLDENFQIDKYKITKIINNWFTIFINHNVFKNNNKNKEYLSLKYCSFLANYQDNPIRAYYELKTLLNRDKKKDENSGKSLFFRLLAKIISKNIETMIFQQIRFERSNRSSDDATKKQEFFYSASLNKLEKFKQKYISSFLEICNLKKMFWEKLLSGYNNIDDYIKVASELCKVMNKLNFDFKIESSEIMKTKQKENVIFLKITSIFQNMVMNDILISYKLERKILEIKKRESLISKEFISSISIVKGNSITIIASLLNDTGKILSKKDKKTAAFFEYNNEDFENLDNIHQLMPKLTAEQHPSLIARYVENGRSNYIQNSRIVFCKNRMDYIFPTKMFYNFVFDFMGNFGICATITKIESSSFYLILNDKGKITNISKGLTNILKINDKFLMFANSNFNILQLIPNLFDNVTLPSDKNRSEDSDQKEILFSNEKIWIYPPKCDVKTFSTNFSEFMISRESKEEIDMKNESDRNFVKNFLIFEDSRLNIRKVLATITLHQSCNWYAEGKFYLKFICEINEIFLNQMLDPDQSTGIRLTENLTNNSKNLLKTTNKDEDSKENSNQPNKSFEGSQNVSIANPLVSLSYADEPKNNEISNDGGDDINMFGHAFFEAAERKKADDSVAPISKDFDEENNQIAEEIKRNDEIELKSDEGNNVMTESKEIARSSSLKKKKPFDENDENKFLFEGSQSSASSLSTNYGSLFLKEFVQGNHTPSIIKKIFVISIFQILFFFSINLIYVFLLKDRINQFRERIDGVEIPHYFMNSYARFLIALTFKYLGKEGIAFSYDQFSEQNSRLRNQAYDVLNQKIDILKQKTYYYDVMSYEENIVIYMGENQTIKNLTLDYFQFINLIQENSYYANKTDISTPETEYFYFFLTNYNALFQINSKVEQMFLQQAEDTKDSLISFYLILSIFGLTFAILLQLVNIPFFFKYYILIEKILMTVARISESECLNEIKIYESYINKLKSTTDEYLTYDFMIEEKRATKKLGYIFGNSAISNNLRKPNQSITSGYLSSKIANQKLKKKNTIILNMMAIVVVVIFFIVIFYFSQTIRNLLENSIDLDRHISELSNFVDTLQALPNIILTFNFTDASNKVSNEQITNIRNLYQDLFKGFNQIYSDLLNNFLYNPEITQTYKDQLRSIMNSDICNIINENSCKLINFNDFQYGLNGYFATLMKNLRELDPYLTSKSSYDIAFLNDYFDKNHLTNSLLDNIIILSARDQFIEIAKNAFDDQITKVFDNILLLFLLGGSACSFFLSFIFLALYYKIKNSYANIRTVLLMIPSKKLKEDSTLYLLRNLQKF